MKDIYHLRRGPYHTYPLESEKMEIMVLKKVPEYVTEKRSKRN